MDTWVAAEVQAPGRNGRYVSRALAPAAVSALLLALATAAAVTLQYGLGVERISVLFALAVMGSSAAYGVGYGVATALGALMAYAFFVEEPRFNFAIGSRPDAANLVFFLAVAWLAGAYTDTIRRRREGVHALYESASVPTTVGQFTENLEDATARPIGWLRREIVSLAGTLGLVAVTTGAAVALLHWFDVQRVSHLFLMGVVATALLLGARFAAVSAVLSAVSFNYFIASPRFVLDLSSAKDLTNLVSFIGVGWWLGRYVDRVREERQAIRLVLRAGARLALPHDESELRQLLCETVSRAAGGVPAIVVDEDGRRTSTRLEAEPPASVLIAAARPPPRETLREGAWRARGLEAEGLLVGAALWTTKKGRATRLTALDETIGAFVDRGAQAILRLRYLAQRSETEVAARTERLREALLASVSHDFRTPLAGIRGAASSLLQFPQHDPATTRDLLENIEEQSRRLSRYMENLLHAARLDAQALSVRAAATPLWPLLEEVWEDSGDVHLLDIQGAADSAALVDPVLLRQVLANVFDNATKFNPVGSTIRATITQLDDRVRLEIADEGPGVPAGEREQIFSRFYRGADTKAAGTGLGLYIARTLTQALGGRIWAADRDDGRSGLVIVLELPSGGAEGE